MYILLGWPAPFSKAKPAGAHNLAPYIHSASCSCQQTTSIPQGQSAYKSHLPLLNALERVPMVDWSADFSQAWALGKEGKEDHGNRQTVLTTIHKACSWPTVQPPDSSLRPVRRSDSCPCSLNAQWQQPQGWPYGRAQVCPNKSKYIPHGNRRGRNWPVERLWTPSSIYVSMIKLLSNMCWNLGMSTHST